MAGMAGAVVKVAKAVPVETAAMAEQAATASGEQTAVRDLKVRTLQGLPPAAKVVKVAKAAMAVMAGMVVRVAMLVVAAMQAMAEMAVMAATAATAGLVPPFLWCRVGTASLARWPRLAWR